MLLMNCKFERMKSGHDSLGRNRPCDGKPRRLFSFSNFKAMCHLHTRVPLFLSSLPTPSSPIGSSCHPPSLPPSPLSHPLVSSPCASLPSPPRLPPPCHDCTCSLNLITSVSFLSNSRLAVL